jgi:hypothetical protein
VSGSEKSWEGQGWSSEGALKQKVLKLWESGALAVQAAAEAASGTAIPLRVALRHPTSADIRDRFTLSRDFALFWSEAGRGRFELSFTQVNSRRYGPQQVPDAAVFKDAAKACEYAGKKTQLMRYLKMRARFVSGFPQLAALFDRKPLSLLEHADDTERLYATLSFMRGRPRPGIYIRQADIFGVDTKFIENRAPILCDLLDAMLPPEAVNAEAPRGKAGFALRYGFKEKPLRVRFRLLDERLQVNGAILPFDDIQCDARSFAALSVPCRFVIVSENEITYLSLPRFEGAIAVLGEGYGFAALQGAKWLERTKIIYWGDLDTHGLAILSQFRCELPRADVRSALMDPQTLLRYRRLWVDEGSPQKGQLPKLTDLEQTALEMLRSEDSEAYHKRLEQERIPLKDACAALESLMA